MAGPGGLRLQAVWAMAALLSATAAAAQPAPTPSLPPGHQRMVAVLAEIARQSHDTNVYTGDQQARAFRTLVADPKFIATPKRQWRNLRHLGYHELRLGNNEAAIAGFAAACDVMAKIKPPLRPADVDRTQFELALAYLRWGESRNCVARHTSDSCILPIRAGGVHADQEGSRKAIKVLEELLARTVDHLPARWLLNVAYMTIGEYPDKVPETYRISPNTFDSTQGFMHFTDVAVQRGLRTIDLGGSVAVEDYDGDTRLDLIVSSSDPQSPLRYFAGRADGTFEDRSIAAGFAGLLGGSGVVQADYDNDGDTDLLILRGAWLGRAGRQPKSLLSNDGHGSFVDVTFDAGLGEINYPSQTAAWADYDRDGFLDLYVGNEGGNNSGYPCQLFRNRGDGTFIDVAAAAGVQNGRDAKGVAWGDFDDDGFPDLYVSNYNDANRLYRSRGDGTFSDNAERAGVTAPRSSQTVVTADFDNDGNLDLYVGATTPFHKVEPYSNRTDELAPLQATIASMLGLPVPPTVEPGRFYRGLGAAQFEEVTGARGLGRMVLTGGVGVGDLDGDGFLDLYLGTTYSGYEGLMPNLLYRNDGGQRFVDITTSAGVGHLQKAGGIAIADTDADGDQDIFINAGGMFAGDRFGDVLFENPGNGNRWIALHLAGVRSNRSAIGARIRVDVNENGKQRSIYRVVGEGSSFGANPLLQWIGVGNAAKVDTITIRWPTGKQQILRDVSLKQRLEIVEVAPSPTD